MGTMTFGTRRECRERSSRHFISACTFLGAVAWASIAQAQVTSGGFMTWGGNTSDVGQGMCIENDSGSLKEEPCAVSGGSFDTNSKQNFVIHSNDHTIHSVISGVDQGCLDLFANNPCNCGTCPCEATLDVTTCNGTGAQQWAFSNGQLTNINHAGYCVDVRGASESAGTQVGLYSCNGGWNQDFLPVNFTVQATASSGECLDVCGNSTSVGAIIDRGTCNGTTAQWFYFEPSGIQYFHGAFRGYHSGRIIGWNQINGDPATLQSDLTPQTCDEEWEYSVTHFLVNACTINGNTCDSCLDVGTNMSCGTETDVKGCACLSQNDQKWDMTMLGGP